MPAPGTPRCEVHLASRLAIVALSAWTLFLGTGATPAAQANECVGAKLNATGKKCSSKAGCIAKAAATGGAVDPACNFKAESKFLRVFGRAEAKGSCTITGNAGAIEDMVDAHLDDLRTD